MDYYRIRMKFGKDGRDFTKEIWQAEMVGIWFGSWDVDHLYAAYKAYSPTPEGQVTPQQIEIYINARLREAGLPKNMSAKYVPLIKKFDEKLIVDTWVFTGFDDALHLGQIEDVLPFNAPQFNKASENEEGDHLKAKKLKNQKTFQLTLLPDAYRNVASAGRNALHKVKSEKLIKLLVDSADEREVCKKIVDLPMEEWLEILGSKSWESLCCAYLILEEKYLPTGLLVGGTLAEFDIVGHRLDGTAVYAQCKKTPGGHTFEEADHAAFDQLPDTVRKFYFSYAGPEVCPLKGVTYITGRAYLRWLDGSEAGQQYAGILRASASVVAGK